MSTVVWKGEEIIEESARRISLPNKSITERVASRAITTPEAIAIVSGESSLSYRELDCRAAALARRLQSLGVGAETVVGLCLRRCPAMVVAALGILKAGGAYLPLDPAYPVSRLAFILADASVPVLIISESVQARVPAGNYKLVVLNDLGQLMDSSVLASVAVGEVNIAPQNLAYIIYTSGSTGQPKGVEVTHESLLNLIDWHQRVFEVTPADRASQLAKLGFDAAVWEIWPYLTAGASLHLPPEAMLNDPESLRDWLLAQEITVSFVPTPLAEQLLSVPWPTNGTLRWMLTGGDTLHSYPATDAPFRLANNYGPTECTVVATSGLVPPLACSDRLPTIGRPIDHIECYILDAALQPVSLGAAGELYIGGKGVARAYRNHPELTAEYFVPHNFTQGQGERLYRTGDLARLLPDGQIAFLGRADDQVKVRGFRIELGEIVAVLCQHPCIAQSVVVAREAGLGDQRLICYFVPTPHRQPELRELREFLGARLPDFMIPSAFVPLERLPLNVNGKIDRAALPEPDQARVLRDETFTAPATEVEKIISDIVASLLGLEQVDTQANFFLLGGHSLLGTQLIVRLRNTFGVDLPLRLIFEAPSVVELSVEVERLLLAKVEKISEDEARQVGALALFTAGGRYAT